MAKGMSVPTRVNADLAAVATSVAHVENRTTTEQINYWIRIGMQVERAASVGHRKILAVATGEDQFSTLTTEEAAAAHAMIDAQVAQRAARERLGPAARRSGETTVSIDDAGQLIEITPKGSRRLI